MSPKNAPLEYSFSIVPSTEGLYKIRVRLLQGNKVIKTYDGNTDGLVVLSGKVALIMRDVTRGLSFDPVAIA